MGFFSRMFERGPSEEDRINALNERIAALKQQQAEVEFYMAHREGDSHFVAAKDAERLATIKKELEEAMAASGESSASEKVHAPERKEAA